MLTSTEGRYILAILADVVSHHFRKKEELRARFSKLGKAKCFGCAPCAESTPLDDPIKRRRYQLEGLLSHLLVV